MLDEISTKFCRFELESQIMNCWSVCDDLKTLYSHSDLRALDENELQNALLGLMTIYHMKFEKLFDMFEQGIRQKQIL
jgi:hypothetical protein